MFETTFFGLAIPAFIAGVLTFLAPCTLPLVPGYLSFISGTSLEDLKDPAKSKQTRWKIFFNGFMFVLGFSLVFVGLGVLAGFVGRGLARYQLWLARIGGIFVIIFGLFMMNVIKVSGLSGEKRLKIPAIFEKGKASNSLVLGAAFGFGWTPCVGPILGSILLLAATSTTVVTGGLLLMVFSAGLAIPFLVLAIGIGHAAVFVKSISKYLKIISIVGGVFLVFLGVLMLTNNFGFFVSYFYKVFGFVGYDNLYDYL